ncbi:hypothetical protein XYCOK13_16560 [Xylanibacillus composti]|uniref:Uncharacterized protein n=1 Tax=Xylanibacillus composti TaxID=1572762 RepID=A0A8J4H3J8_9BACL|nr:hypothetical protein XYCOK13_16560 [Xylanibacillus composti]
MAHAYITLKLAPVTHAYKTKKKDILNVYKALIKCGHIKRKLQPHKVKSSENPTQDIGDRSEGTRTMM